MSIHISFRIHTTHFWCRQHSTTQIFVTFLDFSWILRRLRNVIYWALLLVASPACGNCSSAHTTSISKKYITCEMSFCCNLASIYPHRKFTNFRRIIDKVLLQFTRPISIPLLGGTSLVRSAFFFFFFLLPSRRLKKKGTQVGADERVTQPEMRCFLFLLLVTTLFSRQFFFYFIFYYVFFF
jgi:hypothetical protein